MLGETLKGYLHNAIALAMANSQQSAWLDCMLSSFMSE